VLFIKLFSAAATTSVDTGRAWPSYEAFFKGQLQVAHAKAEMQTRTSEDGAPMGLVSDSIMDGPLLKVVLRASSDV
jgi:hypothetical protein